MKIKQDPVVFQPVTIVLEDREEVNAVKSLIRLGQDKVTRPQHLEMVVRILNALANIQ